MDVFFDWTGLQDPGVVLFLAILVPSSISEMVISVAKREKRKQKLSETLRILQQVESGELARNWRQRRRGGLQPPNFQTFDLKIVQSTKLK